jgi:hypothetical protein
VFPVDIDADGPNVTLVPTGIPVLAKLVAVNVTFGVGTVVPSANDTEAGVVPLKVSCVVVAAIGYVNAPVKIKFEDEPVIVFPI